MSGTSDRRTREMDGMAAEGGTLPIALAVLCLGIFVGLGLSRDISGEFLAGVALIGGLSACLIFLSGGRDSKARRTAGEASYRAFFDHAVEGIFRTTPDGRYLVANQ